MSDFDDGMQIDSILEGADQGTTDPRPNASGSLQTPKSRFDQTEFSTEESLKKHRDSQDLDHTPGSVKLRHLEKKIRTFLENLVQGSGTAHVLESIDIKDDLNIGGDMYLNGNLVEFGGEELPLGIIMYWDKSLEAKAQTVRCTGTRWGPFTDKVIIDDDASFSTDSVSAGDIVWTEEDPALFLDGVDDVGSKSLSTVISGNSTIECWFYCTGDGNGSNGNILEIGSWIDTEGYGFWQEGTTLEIRDSSANHPSTGYDLLNGWHHLAAVYDGTDIRVYVDGALEYTLSSATVQNTAYASIGKRKGYAQYAKGYISDVRVWNTDRTQQQIQDNMYKRISPQSNLILYWKLDEGEGTVLVDSSGNNEDGTLSGSAIYSMTEKLIVPSTIVSVDSETQVTIDYEPTVYMLPFLTYTIYQEPDIQPGWIEMDGSTISDPDSPFDGMTIIDVIGEERFIRARKTAGRLQSHALQYHAHSISGSITGGNGNDYGDNSKWDRQSAVVYGPIDLSGHDPVQVAEETRAINISAVPILKIKSFTQTKLATYYKIDGTAFKDLSEIPSLEDLDKLVVYNNSSDIYNSLALSTLKDYMMEDIDTIKVVHMQHRLDPGVASGTVTGGQWNTCPLNHVAHNTITDGVILNTGTYRFTLPPGKYLLDATRSSFYTNAYVTRLFNITDSTTELMGEKGYGDIGDGYNTDHTPIKGIIEITEQKTFELQLYAQSTRSNDGFGFNTNSYGNVDSVWSDVVIIDLNSLKGVKGDDGIGATWDSGKTYSVDNVVVYNDTLYRSRDDMNQGNTPDTSPTYWEQITTMGFTKTTDEYDSGWVEVDLPGTTNLYNTTIGSSGPGTDIVHNLNLDITELEIHLYLRYNSGRTLKHPGGTQYDGGSEGGITYYQIDKNTIRGRTGYSWGLGMWIDMDDGHHQHGPQIDDTLPYWYRFIIHPRGGAKGNPPAHQWNGNELRFENPDGTWGVYNDLQGPYTVAPTWDSGTTYSEGAIVSHNAIPYISLADSNTEEPGTGSNWEVYGARFVIDVRTSDPTSPMTGQIWFRSDLV